MPSSDRAPIDLARIRAIVGAARAAGRSSLLEPEGLALLDAAGIAVPRWRRVATGDEVPEAWLAGLPGGSVVVKAVVPGLAHKTEAGAVAIVERSAPAVRAAIDAMSARLAGGGTPPDSALLVEHVPHDVSVGGELLVALRWTDDLGPIVVVGAGGVDAEALGADLRPERAIAVLSPSLTPPGTLPGILQAATAVRLATAPWRGRAPRMELRLLEDLVGRLFALAAACAPDDLLEVELNPAAVTAAGPIALDVLVRLGPAGRVAAPPRPLHRIGRLLEPRSIAVVGVSSGSNPGRVILRNLLREGFPRDGIRVIKPGAERIDGVRCVPDLASLPAPVDLLVVALSATQAPDFVAEAVERGAAGSLIVIPAGFDETRAGAERAARLRASIARSRSREDGGPVLVGGNCLGIRSWPGRYDTLFIPHWKLPPHGEPAPLALVTGSGAFAVTRLSRLTRLHPRYVVTIGNQMDLTAGDWLEHFAGDPGVRVVGVYVEGFAPLDGRRFLEAAARIVADGRRVVLYRAGRTPAGASASASHTASIAGDAVVARALARQAGVAWAETPGEFDDLVRAFTLLDGRPARGRRLGALSNAGSECVTIADHLGTLRLADLAPATVARLSAILTPAGIGAVVDLHNPLDLTPIADAAIYEAAARAILEAAEVDLGLVGIVPITDILEALEPGPGHDEDLDRPGALVGRMAALWRETAKPWVIVVDVGPQYDPFVGRLEAAGIPVFRTADAATRTLAAWSDLAG